MRRFIVLLFLFSFMFFSGCGFRLMKYKRAVRNLKSQEISQDEFDQKVYTFKKELKKDNSGLVKFQGAYVYQDKNEWFYFYKFSKDGRVVESSRMENQPNSVSMLNKFSRTHYYYRVLENNKIELEYYSVYNWNLHNHVISGYISGDTIFLTEDKAIQSPLLKPKEINVKCIYDSTLTARPLW
jgi:hypothetical protein